MPKLLDHINTPEDLKALSIEDLRAYCDELRAFIIGELASNPGHLASSLGVVELTAALHYVYNTPHDKLVWDVGHQAYAHKIITARRDLFPSNRKRGGISGFPKMSESPYDAFGAGHASVSISAALGLAKAATLTGTERDVVAIIGDGALTGGLAFEGLNNAGASNTDLLVILNDNHMSIDPNVGALKEYLLSITTSKRYNRLKNRTWIALNKAPRLRNWIKTVSDTLKIGFLRHSNLFESLNFRYFGPVDGHDVKALTRVLRDLKEIPGPKLLHVLTVKGKGYKPAEDNQSVWHAPGRFNPDTGERIPSRKEGYPPLFQNVFGETLLELAQADERIVGITPAMPTGCSMNIMMERMPARCFDVGIAEGHAVTFSAGLAASGLVPFCNIYSSFMQRAFDNVIHDVALQGLGVVFCLDRAGLVGEDGPTHHGAYDVAYMRCIPGMVVAAPMDEVELRDMMYTASRSGRPFTIRYPRGHGSRTDWRQPFSMQEIGRGRILREGNDVAVVTLGTTAIAAAEAIGRAEAQGVSALHADLRYAKPLDEALLDLLAGRFRRIITVEDGCVSGGAGSAVLEYLASRGYGGRVEILGIPDRFVEHGTPAELRAECGYDADSILRTILAGAAPKNGQ